MSSPHLDFVTPGEYLELERKSEIRSEYIAGRIFARSGASRRHNLIAGNLQGLIWTQMRGRPCEVYAGEMRVKVSPTGMYTYPDIVAVCGEARFEDAQIDTLLNPAVIVEVLSESTEAYDRGEKFAHYRRLDTLHEYVLVAQNKVRVEQARRRTVGIVGDQRCRDHPPPRVRRLPHGTRGDLRESRVRFGADPSVGSMVKTHENDPQS